MTIQNAALPNLTQPGVITQTPLTGNELVEVAAGPVFTTNTVAGVADTALVDQSVTTTGSSRTGAYVITGQVTNITTATASAGVVLPTANKPGMKRIIFNSGAAANTVYALGTDTIDGTAGSTGVVLTNGNRCAFYCVAAGKWLSAQLGAVSS